MPKAKNTPMAHGHVVARVWRFATTAMYDASRSEIQKFASEGTKQGGDNHQTTILGLVRPTAHDLSRAGFPPPPTLPCCGTYLQGGNGVGVQGDSTARDPAHCRDSAPGLLVGSGMDTGLRGFLHAEPGARAHTGALMLRFPPANTSQ